MALSREDRVQDSTTTTGTGTISLAATAPAGFRTFVSAVTSGDTVRYLIESADRSEWEVGEGVFTDGSPDTLTRVTIYSSSNAGSLVNFSAGTKKVILIVSAQDLYELQDWVNDIATVPTINSIDKEVFELNFASIDLTSRLSEGMRIKLSQTPGSNTKSLDLESSSSQYASKTDHSALSITGNITVEAWIKPESLAAGTILSKWYQDGTLKSYGFFTNTTGSLSFSYSGDGNNESGATSGLIIAPEDLGTWIHVAVSVVVSTRACSFYKNGVLVGTVTATGTQSAIHDNSSTFAIGARDIQGTPDTFFDGKIAEVRLWSTNRTQAQIREKAFSNLVGNETNLNGYWKLNDNYNDTTSNANNLTSSGSPVFATDVPLRLTNGTKYGFIVENPTFSTNTTVRVFCGKEYGIGSETISGFMFSSKKYPFGYPNNIGSPFRAKAMRALSVQSITNAYSYTKVQLNGVVYDPHNDFDETTNYRYTAPRSGFYHVSASTEFGSLASSYTSTRVTKNGTVSFCMQQNAASSISNNMQSCATIVYLEEGEYVELETSHNGSGAAKNIEYANNLTFLEITFLHD